MAQSQFVVGSLPPMLDASRKVVLLIDYDNLQICASRDTPGRDLQLDPVVKLAQKYGTVLLARAYAEWNLSTERLAVYKAGIEPAFAPVLRTETDRAGKSLADTVMVAEGMDILWTLTPDVLVLATSDKDLIPLVRVAKQRGARVVVIGSDLTAIPLREMADEHVTYKQLVTEVAARAAEFVPGRQPATLPEPVRRAGPAGRDRERERDREMRQPAPAPQPSRESPPSPPAPPAPPAPTVAPVAPVAATGEPEGPARRRRRRARRRGERIPGSPDGMEAGAEDLASSAHEHEPTVSPNALNRDAVEPVMGDAQIPEQPPESFEPVAEPFAPTEPVPPAADTVESAPAMLGQSSPPSAEPVHGPPGAPGETVPPAAGPIESAPATPDEPTPSSVEHVQGALSTPGEPSLETREGAAEPPLTPTQDGVPAEPEGTESEGEKADGQPPSRRPRARRAAGGSRRGRSSNR
jgi:uncharacterized LabA/DUF88 family protein